MHLSKNFRGIRKWVTGSRTRGLCLPLQVLPINSQVKKLCADIFLAASRLFKETTFRLSFFSRKSISALSQWSHQVCRVLRKFERTRITEKFVSKPATLLRSPNRCNKIFTGTLVIGNYQLIAGGLKRSQLYVRKLL